MSSQPPSFVNFYFYELQRSSYKTLFGLNFWKLYLLTLCHSVRDQDYIFISSHAPVYSFDEFIEAKAKQYGHP
jgi:hypothetical protein